MTVYIYARVSRTEQSTDSQVHALLQKFPDAQVVTEKKSGARGRPILESLLVKVQQGDTLAVFALDRLGRRHLDALKKLYDLKKKGVKIFSLREGEDFVSAEGEFLAGIMLQVAQLEHHRISARIKAGMAARRAKGLPHWSKRKFTPSQLEEFVRLISSKEMKLRQVSRKYDISRQYLYELMRNGVVQYESM